MKIGGEPAEWATADEKSIIAGQQTFTAGIVRPPSAPRTNVKSSLLTWGSAALHPRLYATGRFADWPPSEPPFLAPRTLNSRLSEFTVTRFASSELNF